MLSKEDGVFFSTSPNGSNNYGYGDTIVRFIVPVEDLTVDDVFGDEASVTLQ